jgi:hypothetical protein
MEVLDGVQFTKAPGIYVYVATITGNPIVWQISVDGGANFQNMTNGSIAASEDNIIYMAKQFTYKVTVPSGDTLFLDIADSGAYLKRG